MTLAKQTILLCDYGDRTCRQPATSYRLWRDGDRQAWSIDLCETHARPLLELVEHADQVELPTRQRVRMEVTPLKTTAKTLPLKKRN